MTGRPSSGRRVASGALVAFEREVDAARAEYRRRERQAAGSGDLWLATRTDVLRQVRIAGEHGAAVTPAAPTPLNSIRRWGR